MSEAPEFAVPVRDLEESVRDYTFPVRRAWLSAQLGEGDFRAAPEDGALTVRLSKSGKDVVVQGRAHAALEAACARCLGPARVPVDAEITCVMVPEGKAAKRDDGEEGADAPDLATYDGQTVVLDEVVRDEILLGIPMIPLCSADCPGMSTAPHPAEPPLDPRLEPLRRIKLSKE